MMSDISTSNPSSTDITNQSELAPLQLAFVGGPRDGQSIRISAAKCTIGSTEQATLRLVCKGVHPTHCMILRGSGGTIVKRMSEDTYLNDKSFEEAELNDNDELTIGPLRFRVLNSEHIAVSTPGTVAAAVASAGTSSEANSEADQLRQRCDELMSQLEALQQERGADAPIENQVAEQSSIEQPVAEEPNDELEQRLMELEAARERDQQELEAKRAEIEAAQVEAQQARDALDAMQQQQQDEAATDVASALGVEAYQQPEPEEYAQNYPQASRTMAMEMLNRLREEEPAVPNPANQSAVEERADESAFTQPLNQYDQAPVGTDSSAVANEQSSYEPPAYEQEQSPVAAENSWEQPESPQSTYEQSPVAGETLYDQTISLSSSEVAVGNSYEQPESPENTYEQSSYEAPVEEQQFQPYDSSTQDSYTDESAVPAPDAPSYSEPNYGESAETLATSEEPETQFESYDPSAADATTAGPTTEEELSFSEPDDSAPIDTASILAKFGHSLEDDDEVTGTISLDDANAAAASSYSDASDEVQSSGGGGEGDESIDDYMTQLMARVGGGDYQAQEKPKSSSSAGSPEKIMLDSNVKKEPEPKKNAAPLNPSEFVPRAVAPEASSNLRALRAVANTSARSAIDRHQRRSFDNKAYICWFIAIVSAIVCFSMAFFAKNLISLPTLVSMVSLLISFFATINALAFSAKAKIGARSTQKKLAANIEEASVPRLPAK